MSLLEIPEKIIKPLVMPYYKKLQKPLKLIPTLPKKATKVVQQWLKDILAEKTRSRDQYWLIGRYYVAKKLLIILLLIVCLLVYFIFIKPPAFLNKWLDRPKVIHLQADEQADYSGLAKVYRDEVFTYIGPLAEGLYEGNGKLYNGEDRLIYEGEFAKGVKEGAGELYDNEGILLYKGSFAEDRYSGMGTLFYPDRTVHYEGEFKNGKFSGSGTEYYADSTIRYAGQFVDGEYTGKGQLFGEKGTLLYEGDFLSGVYHGIGKLNDSTGAPLYEGGFVKGLYSGDGTEFHAGGVPKYIGQFAAGVYQGKGESYSSDGKLQYSGEFAGGLYHGLGKSFDAAGTAIYEGKYAEGLYEGFGSLLDPDGNVVFKSYFDDGAIKLESFIGLASGKLEEMLGAPADVVVPEFVLEEESPQEAEAPLPSTVEYSYAPMSLSFEMSVPVEETEQPIVKRVRVWNPYVLNLLPIDWRNHPPFLDKADPADQAERIEGENGTYTIEYIIEDYYYSVAFHATGEIKWAEIHRV